MSFEVKHVVTACFKFKIKLDFKFTNPFVNNLLFFLKEKKYSCFLNSNYNAEEASFIAAYGVKLITDVRKLPELVFDKKYLFGNLSYDFKNYLESEVDFRTGRDPSFQFFEPQVVFILKNEELEIISFCNEVREKELKEIFKNISESDYCLPGRSKKIKIHPRITKQQYLESVERLIQHIHLGNIYEVNFCQEFFAANANIDPIVVYLKLNEISEAPFSAFAKFDDQYIISSSPERFLKKEGKRIFSQPIKGTKRRGKTEGEDDELKKALKADKKEQSENIMIVDLVRNDLSRIADKGTVKVEELNEVYTFKQVHQLISTVSAEVREGINFLDILKATFPMGSMTGAPKIRAMELIDKYEASPRGLYSGSLGYITPDGDFDFNVLIRTIFYNSTSNYLSFSVGSAITALSDPEAEYDECMVKAKAMFESVSS